MGKTNDGQRALLVAILVLFLVATTTGWVVASGVRQGSTRLPVKQGMFRRRIERAREPAMFWVSIGIYAVISVGTATLGVLAVREQRRA